MPKRPEDLAALVNGLLVVLVPLAFLVLGSYVFDRDSQYSVTVRATDPAPLTAAIDGMLVLGQIGLALLPFAAVAAWRTWVHARRWPKERGWQGVADAGLCGLGFALLYLAPGILTHPREAPAYFVVYGGGAMILGLLVGLLLRTAAVVVLTLRESTPP
jgi:hypothetical protein